MKKFLTVFSFFFLCFLTLVNAATAQNRKAVSAAEVTGTFRDASGSEFKILARGKGKVRIAFSGVYNYRMANGELMANLGEAVGEAEIVGDTAVFKPKDTNQQCAITIKFLTNGRLKVRQHGTDTECGFGANVSADGNYKKVSRRAKPKFTAHQKHISVKSFVLVTSGIHKNTIKS